MKRSITPLVLLICLTLLGVGRLTAQVETAQVSGIVNDNEGKPLPGAAVVITGLETGYVRAVATSDSGAYHFYALPPGKYEIMVQQAGFHDQKQQLQIMINQTGTMNFKMIPLQYEAREVTVVALAPSMELKKTDVSTPVTKEQINALPLDSRNLLGLAAIAPGVRSYGQSDNIPNAGAVNTLTHLNMYVDGADWKAVFNANIVGNGQTSSPIPELSVQEFRVILNSYDAEFSRGGAYIVSAITKRGTNQFHGSALFTLENKALTAKNHFQSAVPDYHRQQAGFALSGPIIKDKLFFAVSYEYYNALNYADVNPGRPAYDPGLWDKYKGTFKSPDKRNMAAINITFQPSQKDLFSLIFTTRSQDKKFYFGGTTAYQAGIFGEYSTYNLMLKNTHYFSDTVLNEVTLQYLAWRHNEPTMTSGPAFVYPSIRLGRGDFPISVNEDHFKLIDKLTFVLDKHVIKTGVELADLRSTPWFPFYGDGEFYFATDVSTMPYRAQIGVGRYHPDTKQDAKVTTKGYALGAFIQDRWEPNSRLSLNFGLRWDGEINMLNNKYRVPWLNNPEIVNNIDPKYLNNGNRKNQLLNFSPRISMNYDLSGNGRTILRVGGGRSFDRNRGELGYYEQLYAAWGVYEIYNPGTTDPAVLRQQVLSGGGKAAAPTIYLLSHDFKLERVDQFSIGIGHNFSETISFGADIINKFYNNQSKAVIANYYKPSIAARTITQKFGNIYLYDSFGKARYHGLLTTVSYNKGGTFAQLAYTLSWAFSDNDGTSYRLKEQYKMARSAFDERHRFVLNWSVKLPLDIEVTGIGMLASPQAFAINIGRDLNDTGTYTDDYPKPDERVASASMKDYKNWYRTLDLRINKYFMLGNKKMSLFLEGYNIFNSFNGSSYFGRMADEAGNPLTNYGQPTQAYQPRVLQLGLRADF